MREDFRPYRDELIISTWGSRKYLLASLDQSLRRMSLEYADIFYSHRFDPERTLDALSILRSLGTPLLIHGRHTRC